MEGYVQLRMWNVSIFVRYFIASGKEALGVC